MNKLFFLSVLLVFLFCRCGDDEMMIQPPQTNDIGTVSSRVSMQEASERLSKIMSRFTPTTKGGANSGIIGQGIALGKDQQLLTRGEESDAWFYYFPIDGGER